MDAGTFDRLARALVTPGSRRRLLSLLTGLPIAELIVSRQGIDARSARKSHRHHLRHARTQRRKDQRNDAHSEACIPTGQRCPSKKPRGKHAKKLGCNKCCQGSFHTEADGKQYCGCQPNGGSCTGAPASSCCSGYCNGATCQAAPCSAAIPCPQCQTCNAATGLCEVLADGTACDDDDACTTGDICRSGVCQRGVPIVCSSGQRCHGGACVCDATTCPTGCCAGGACYAGYEDAACGADGGLCASCSGSSPYCVRRTCAACSGSHPCPTGQCCAADGSCGACLVFVTSVTYLGDLGGLQGADDKCQGLATAAGLPGDYLAWLSDDSDSPSTRFVQATVPYQRRDGVQVAENWADLIDGSLAAAISVTEAGGTPPSLDVWTGTDTDGTPNSAGVDATCVNWSEDTFTSGYSGNPDATDSRWTASDYPACNGSSFGGGNALYCFQQR